MTARKPNHKYINCKTTYFHRGSGPDADNHDPRLGVLIFGDEVEVFDEHENERRKVSVRGRIGWVAEKALGDERALECYFIDVGQGDSTFIVTPRGKTILIDGGVNRRALGFLAWKYRLDEHRKPLTIDLLVLSHADGDHLDGLAPILADPRIHVKRIVHSGLAVYADANGENSLGEVEEIDGRKFLLTRHDGLHELSPTRLSKEFRRFYDAVDRERSKYGAVDSTSDDIDLGDPHLKIEVLGPHLVPHPRTQAPCLPYLSGGFSPTINGHSVVLRLTYGEISILLPGDINEAGTRHLLNNPEFRSRLSAHVLKAPHHGSKDFHPDLLDACAPQIAVISSGDDVDHGHPRAAFLGAVGRSMRSPMPLVFSTEIAANFAEVQQPSDDDSMGDTGLGRARSLFKRRLHGMINVRSDGRNLYAFRRVVAGYAWESYGPLEAAPHPRPSGSKP